MAKHRLYHKDFPEGKLFDNEADITKAIKDGFEDAPLNHLYRKVKKVGTRKITSVNPKVGTVKRKN